jgi:hypothetical protein
MGLLQLFKDNFIVETGERVNVPLRCRNRVNSLSLRQAQDRIYRRAAFPSTVSGHRPRPGDPRCLALNEGIRLLPCLTTFQAEGRRVANERLSI